MNCQAAFIPKLNNFYKELPANERTEVRLQGLRGMRRSATQTMLSTISDVVNPRRSRELSLEMLDAWVKSAPSYASIFTLEERQSMSKQIREAGDVTPRVYRDKIYIISSAFETKECNTLCQTH